VAAIHVLSSDMGVGTCTSNIGSVCTQVAQCAYVSGNDNMVTLICAVQVVRRVKDFTVVSIR